MFDNVRENFKLGHHSDRIGEAFVLSFATGLVLSCANPATAVFVGGAGALATSISAVVKPVFMGLLGYKSDDKPGFLAYFFESVVVLSAHSYIMSGFDTKMINWIGVAILSGVTTFMSRKSLVSDPQMFVKLETFIAMEAYKRAHAFFNKPPAIEPQAVN